jgi:hypothetical protein
MKYRLIIIFLASLLFASFSFNCLHYDALLRAEYDSKFNSGFDSKIIEKLHQRLIEVENE